MLLNALKGLRVIITAILKGLFIFCTSLFPQNNNASIKNNYGNSKFELFRTVVVSKHWCVPGVPKSIQVRIRIA